MTTYPILLFLHLLFVLAASVAAALTMYGALCLRGAESSAEAGRWLGLIGRVVPLFPLAAIGLLATGAFLTAERWSWSLPWVQAALVGLILIMALGSGVEAGRGRALKREMESAGWSDRARRLVRDPVAWSAKLTTLTLALAVVFVMTIKPGREGSGAALAVALVTGLLGAVPFWRERRPRPIRGG